MCFIVKDTKDAIGKLFFLSCYITVIDDICVFLYFTSENKCQVTRFSKIPQSLIV